MKRIHSIGKTDALWATLSFLRYGLRYRLGLGRKRDDNADVRRINLLAVEHCNNACRYCSTSSPHSKRKVHQASAFFPWLDLLERAKVRFSNIAITGGEPFLHPNLPAFVGELKERYPDKHIGMTTNFYWGNEDKIRDVAPLFKSLDSIVISKYPNILAKLGGEKRFNSMVDLLRRLCPQTRVSATDGAHMISWELHANAQKVSRSCATSDCYVLRADGNISHCAIGAGLENRPEYLEIIKQSKERLFDLGRGVDGFLPWINKYPFDLCYHCTLWRSRRRPWQPEGQKHLATAICAGV